MGIPRKIVQVVDKFVGKDDEAVLVALADDGTLWEGCQKCTNQKEILAAQVQRNIDKATTVPVRVYAFTWEQLPGLPDDNRNLTRVK